MCPLLLTRYKSVKTGIGVYTQKANKEDASGPENGFCKRDYYHDRRMMCFPVDRPVAVR